ncbi:serine hydrolase domain-containing protein [Maribacter sp. HTCC2170]|uniref:serine hydrolase domain-containing protein n=1 Tax=Maribacter sp. (strain HTCC2170 / KCCM 42371) TaxID=313603 RepID=UPI00006BB140|nr:serine hydrolase domain-containing protein [Maribacter sp. HTCC2170]EAQ99623.1 penicillin-binding protein 4* [Maribacter sp. HTCC2170]
MENRVFKIKKLVILILVLAFGFIGNSQIAHRIDSLAKIHASQGFNGNVLYSKNDKLVFTGNYGWSDFSSKKVLNDSTIFELASVSKQFTAAAIVQLAENGLLHFNDNVKNIIKAFPYPNITIEHLLRHQSGLPDIQKLLYQKRIWNRKKQATHRNVPHVLSSQKLPLSFEPGTKYEYNNTGYAMLALIIEVVSKQPYETYVQTNLFNAAGMTHSKVYSKDLIPNKTKNIALGHTFNKKSKKYQKVENDSNHKHIHWMNGVLGDSGVYSSILDLEKWKKALRENILISEKSFSKMTSVDNVSKKYGYGLAIYETKSKGKWVYHNGSWSGYKTSVIYLPKSNEHIVILSNNRYAQTYKSFEDELYKLIQ